MPFERHSIRYDHWFLKHETIYHSELRAIRSLMPAKGKSIEIGVGSGRFAAPLGITLGVEPSQKMARIARRRGIKVIEAIAEKLPFAHNQFDLVFMVTTICFVDDIQQSVSEIYRILKPGGCFINAFIDADSPLGQAYQTHKAKNVFYQEASFFSTDEIIKYLKKAGFTEFSFAQTIFHNPGEIKKIEPVKSGYGEGSFIVVKAIKT